MMLRILCTLLLAHSLSGKRNHSHHHHHKKLKRNAYEDSNREYNSESDPSLLQELKYGNNVDVQQRDDKNYENQDSAARLGNNQKKDYNKFLQVSPQELNAAYQMVNNGQFDRGYSQGDNQGQKYSSPANQKNWEPVLNRNDISGEAEPNINLGSHSSGFTNYKPNDGYKKSQVPDTKQEIPKDEPHPDGIHIHLTQNEIIKHKGDEPNFTGVSRYPPYVNNEGKSVSGPPPHPETAAISPVRTATPGKETPLPVLTVPLRNEGIAPENKVGDDARCNLYPTSICYHQWMKNHCSNKCMNQTTEQPVAVQPSLNATSAQGHFLNMSAVPPASDFVVPAVQPANTTVLPPASDFVVPGVQPANTTVLPPASDFVVPGVQPANTVLPPASDFVVPAVQPANGSVLPPASDFVVPPVKPVNSTVLPPASDFVIPPVKPVNSTVLPPASDFLAPPVKPVNSTVLPPASDFVVPAVQPVNTTVLPVASDFVVPATTSSQPAYQPASSGCELPSYGGNSYGACCTIPFNLNGKPQYGCVLQPGTGYWCGTSGDFDRDQKWGLCGPCIQPPCATTTQTTTTATTTTTEAPTTTTTPQPKKPVVCTQWGDWSECSATCGFGQRVRETQCGMGKFKNETKQCYLSDCPPVCDPWSEYTECTRTCGGGAQTHQRNCSITDNVHTDILEFTESRVCNTRPCPVEWTAWSEWTECTRTCGGGTQERRRMGSWMDLGRIITTPQTQQRECNTQACEPLCGEWGEWTECSKSCDGGLQERTRDCYGNNENITLDDKQTQQCNEISCYPPFCGHWSAFTECSVSCGGGIMLRWRTCDGVYDEQNITCNEIPCPIPPPIPPVCSEWGEWSPCSATCNGMQTRVHYCKNDTHESDELQARPCGAGPCQANTTATPSTTPLMTTVNTLAEECTEWSGWSECAQPCGGGYQERYRTCLRLQQDIETRICNLEPCPQTTPAPVPPYIPVPECIVAHLSFDNVDREQYIIYDDGPYGNHATYDGDVDFVRENFTCGMGVQLHNDGEVWFNRSSFQNIPVNGISVIAWIYADSTLYSQALFPTSDYDDFKIELEAGTVKWSKTDIYGRMVFAVSSNVVFTARKWFHLALTYNATIGLAYIYVNDIDVTAGQTSAKYQQAQVSNPHERFHGLMDELFIYNCSLDIDQIRLVANTCKGTGKGGCPSPALGVCPVCPTCNITTTPTPATTTTEIPPSNNTISYPTQYPIPLNTTSLNTTSASENPALNSTFASENPSNTTFENNPSDNSTSPDLTATNNPHHDPGSISLENATRTNPPLPAIDDSLPQNSTSVLSNQSSSDSPLLSNLPKGYFPKHEKHLSKDTPPSPGARGKAKEQLLRRTKSNTRTKLLSSSSFVLSKQSDAP